MAALSTLPSGRGPNSRGVEQEPNSWEHKRRSSQDRPATSFSKPFAPTSQADQSSRYAQRPPTRQQANGTSKYSHAVAQQLGGQPEPHNDNPHTAPTSGPQNDSNYLSPYNHNIPKAANISRSGSEADSLLELYGRPKSTSDSIERRDNKTPPQPTLQPPMLSEFHYISSEDPESSKWVHRDKLAMIESEELQQAGIKLPRHSSLRGRSNSKNKSSRGHSRGHSRGQSITGKESEVPQSRDGQRQRVRSPERQQEGTPTIPLDFDLRTPEEIASSPYESSMYRQSLRSSSSRIPLPTSSPMPIPQEHRERHTPLPRTRGASGTWDGEDHAIAYPKSRSRSHSVGSQVLLDDVDPSQPSTSTPNPTNTPSSPPTPGTSPSKPIRSASTKPLPTAAAASARKASAALRNAQQQEQQAAKQRSTSTTSARSSPASAARPKSRSGLDARPATAIDRPEGEAPWLATMYKPDPRLPPDQQVIPTHAKRMQEKEQEQAQKKEEWARRQGKPSPVSVKSVRESPGSRKGGPGDGKEGDRGFSPVAVHTNQGLQPPSPIIGGSPRAINEKSGAERPGWPLAPESMNKKPHGTDRSPDNANGWGSEKPGGGGGNEAAGGGWESGKGGGSSERGSSNGGYSTMPKVKANSPVGARRTGQVPRQESIKASVNRRGDGKEKEEDKEGGCCSCVLM